MFIATTHTPDAETEQEKAVEDFIALIGRSCEYIKELENLGKIKKGSFIPLYEMVCTEAKKTLEQNWNA